MPLRWRVAQSRIWFWRGHLSSTPTSRHWGSGRCWPQVQQTSVAGPLQEVVWWWPQGHESSDQGNLSIKKLKTVTIWFLHTRNPNILLFGHLCPVFEWADHIIWVTIQIPGILYWKQTFFVLFSDHHLFWVGGVWLYSIMYPSFYSLP